MKDSHQISSRELARRAIHEAVGGKFTIADVMAATTDVIVEVVGCSFETIEEAELCADAIGKDIARLVRMNWQELAWARQMLHAKSEGRA